MLIHVIRKFAEKEEDPLDRSVLLDLANAMEETPDDPFVTLGLLTLATSETAEPEVLDAAKTAVRRLLDRSPNREGLRIKEDA